jgi:hypothetical protein
MGFLVAIASLGILAGVSAALFIDAKEKFQAAECVSAPTPFKCSQSIF